jgi:hypothetical protein
MWKEKSRSLGWGWDVCGDLKNDPLREQKLKSGLKKRLHWY